MAYTKIKFDVEVTIVANPEHLVWPSSEEVEGEVNPGCNREYIDLRGCSIKDAEEAYEVESAYIERLEEAEDLDEEYNAIEDEMYEDVDTSLHGLDIGVASAVIALSAYGCVPFTSCSAGAYGGDHYEKHHPVVGFFTKPEALGGIIECAEQSSSGLYSDGGALILYADEIEKVRKFARLLISKMSAETS